jgi:hypothetical protein
VEFQAQLACMYADRTVFYRAVVGSLPEDGDADVVFGQFMAVAVNGTFGHVRQKFAQAS